MYLTFQVMCRCRIVALHENGVIQYLAQKWLSPRNKCLRKRTLGNQLDLEIVKIVFILLLWGIAIAIFLLFMEIASSHLQNKTMALKHKMRQSSQQ